MGLDAYIWSTPVVPTKQVDFNDEVYYESADGPITTELAYWRKCYPLHKWMEELYYKKGGKSKSFNCDTVQLTTEDLTELIEDAEDFEIEHGQMRYIIDVAEEAIQHIILTGETVFYDSWW